MSACEEVRGLLRELQVDAVDGILGFYDALVKENAIQNLTRLTDPKGFVEGHVIDVLELHKSGLLDVRTESEDQDGSIRLMDLGSGGGVPGLLSAAVTDKYHWTLLDSEASKVAFLKRTSEELGIDDHVSCTASRVEHFLNSSNAKVPRTIVSRAVGPVLRLFNWIHKSPYWETLILLKGPRWDKEWAKFNASQHKGKLTIAETYNYTVGEEKKTRIIVKLQRVKTRSSNKKRKRKQGK